MSLILITALFDHRTLLGSDDEAWRVADESWIGHRGRPYARNCVILASGDSQATIYFDPGQKIIVRAFSFKMLTLLMFPTLDWIIGRLYCASNT